MLCSRPAVRSWVAQGNAGEAHRSRPNGSVSTWMFTPWCRFLPQ